MYSKKENEDKSVSPTGWKENHPQVYSIRRDESGWHIDRRSFVVGSVAAGLTVAGKQLGADTLALDRIQPPGGKNQFGFCQEVRAHGYHIHNLTVSSDGSLLATTSMDKYHTVKLWAAPFWNLLALLEGHKEQPGAIAFSPDGKWLVSGEPGSGEMIIWSITKKKIYKRVKAYFSNVADLAITPDNKHIVSIGLGGEKGGIKMWSLPKGKLVKQWGDSSTSRCLALSPNGNILATHGGFDPVALWSMKKGEEGEVIKRFGKFGDSPFMMKFSPDGKYFIYVVTDAATRKITIWKTSSWNLFKTLSFSRFALGLLYDVDIDRKSKMMAIAAYGSWIQIRTFPSGTLKKTLGEKDRKFQYPSSLTFDPNENILYSGYSYEGRIWDYKKGRLKQCLIDLKDTLNTAYGRTYEYNAEGGKVVTVTVPDCKCAPKMPSGAKCTCDTVPGEAQS